MDFILTIALSVIWLVLSNCSKTVGFSWFMIVCHLLKKRRNAAPSLSLAMIGPLSPPLVQLA